MNDWAAGIAGGLASLTGIAAAAKAAVNAYAEMDQEMANVRKFTGMSAQEVETLNEEFKKMDTRSSREELNKLAQEAGRLGKTSQEDVLGFVRAADKINVALDDLGDGATLTLSKLAGIFGDEKRLGTEKALLSIGSVINELSQNCSASAPYLAEFASRMGGVGAQAGLTAQQIMGFAAVLDSNNQAVEASATALSQVIVRIYQDPAKYARVARLDIEKFAKLVKTDMNSALIELLSTLKQAGNMDVLSPMFKDMGENGSRAISALSTLAGHIGEVKAQQEVANEAFREAVSIDNEFNVQNTTVQAGLDKAKKQFTELAVSLGEKLLPVTQHLISASSVVVRTVSAIVDFVIEYKGQIAVLTAAIVAYNAAVALAAARTKALAVAAALQKAALTAQTLAYSAMNAAMLLFAGRIGAARREFARFLGVLRINPFGLVLSAIAAVTAAVVYLTREIDAAAKAQKELNGIRVEAQKSISEQKTKIETLIAAAKNERLTLEERHRAIAELNRIIPGYNASLDDTTGKYRASKEALDEYLVSLAKKYEIEGAEAKLKDLGRQKAELTVAIGEDNKKLDKYGKSKMQGGGLIDSDDAAAVSLDLGRREARLAELRKKQRELEAVNKSIEAINRAYGTDLQKKAASADSASSDTDAIGSAGGNAEVAANKATADKFKAEKEWKDREEALERIRYATGETDEEQHEKRMADINLEYIKKKMAKVEDASDEMLRLRAEYAEQEKKMQQSQQKWDTDSADRYYAEKLAALRQAYIDGKVSSKTYEDEEQRLETEHLRTMVYLYEQGTEERIKAEKAYRDRLFTAQEKKRKETEDAERKHQAELDKIRREVFRSADTEGYKNDLALLDEAKAAMLETTAEGSRERLNIEEAYLRAKLELQRKYGILETEQTDNLLKDLARRYEEWMDSDGGQAFTKTFDTVSSHLSAIFSQLTDSVQSELELQTAAIEQRYEREISAAEGNNYKVKKLERQRDDEIAKAKNEASRKQFSMQVIQALAQTAQNALGAYGSTVVIPIVGPTLAPIAAAAAMAAGMLQVAAIKKQQQAAASQGYAEGGFTKKGSKYEPAGIVHAGEWVASQALVNSPAARPIIDALDYAQRTNTIGSLMPADVSRSVTAPAAIAAAAADGSALAAVAAVLSANRATIDRLNARLDEPFVTVNTVTGDTGIKRAQDEYETLIRNKTPKSRRK